MTTEKLVLHITHRDVYDDEGNPRDYRSNRDCPLACAFRRKTGIENCTVGGSYIRTEHPYKWYHIGYDSNGYFLWDTDKLYRLKKKLEQNPHAYTRVVLHISH